MRQSQPLYLSKSELISVHEIIESSLNCYSIESLRKLLALTKELIPAERRICGLGRFSPGLSPRILLIANCDYPDEWVSEYSSEKLYLVDPVIRYHTLFTTTYNWDDAFKACRNTSSEVFRERAAANGLKYGLSGGVYSQELCASSIFSFAHGEENFATRHLKILNTVLPHLHRALINMTPADKQSI